MKSSWFLGLLFSLVLAACRTAEVPPVQEPPPPQGMVPEVEVPLPPAIPESPPVEPPGEEVAPWDQDLFALYLITTDPPGVGILREGGELIGLTPLTIRLKDSRAFRLTFLKKGFTIVGKFIRPEPGRQTYHLVMTPEE